MIGISEFFKKIQGSFAKEIIARTIIKEAIRKYVGADIPIEMISIKGSSIILGGVNQSVKSAIYIKKQSILKDVVGTKEHHYIKDIR